MVRLTCILTWMLINVCTLPAAMPHPFTTQDSENGSDFRIFEDKINAFIQTTLEKYDPIKLPFLPALNINMDDIDLALTMTEVEIGLFSELRVTSLTVPLFSPVVHLNMTLPRLSLTAGQYAAAGHLLNLELYGEGPMSLDLYDLKVTVQVKKEKVICIAYGSSKFWINLDHWEVNFEGMNSDSDQGQLVNIVLSTFGPEIFDYIENLLNGDYHKTVDEFLVKQLNKAIGSTLGSTECD